jgi:mersacidin/lichenicidin family type 2 lantibiotic
MSYKHVVRAWKDKKYRLNLSEAERAQLPTHPAGTVELTEADLGKVAGGFDPGFTLTRTVCLPCIKPPKTPTCPT